MRLVEYSFDELRFPFMYYVYVRCQTHCRQPSPKLPELNKERLASLVEPLEIHVLECECDSSEMRLQLSLRPGEAVATAVSKVKGQAAKWLREQSRGRLARGYFACSSGKNKADEVEAYLSAQGEHHGYSNRPRPPVFVKTFARVADDERLESPHAKTLLRFHVVLSTWRRRGVFGEQSAQAVCEAWQSLRQAERFSLLKASFVPDHVHLAVRVHRSIAPGRLVTTLMNAAQEVIWQQFASDAIQAQAERLFQPNAYIGSFGDLATPQIEAYMRNWRAGTDVRA
jgi:REP element-mobilizing transposase RayT